MKKIINIALVATVMAGAAVTAQATDMQVNMYGASAQRDYWTDLGETFLKSSDMGCQSAHIAKIDSNYIAVKGETCTFNSGDDIYITYASVASLEGVRAAKNTPPLDGTLNDSCGGDNNLREIVNATTCDFSKDWPVYDNGVLISGGIGSCSSKVCADVQLGTSDVEGMSFDQESHGQKNGHKGGGLATGTTLTPESITGLVSYKPTIVPFAFYANNELGTSKPTGDLANLTRTQAVNLFAGNVAKWGQLRGFEGYPNDEVMLCLRHAGSGTHATLDKAVFRGDNIELIENERDFNSYDAPFAYFYQSSSKASPAAGMKECIETNGGQGLFSGVIAVGYLDADATSNKIHQLKYQGAPAVDTENAAIGKNDYINNGSYDFWSAQNVYLQTTDDTDLVKKMMTYAENNIPTSKYGIWTKKADLKVTKASDTSIPVINPVVVEE
jgi:hypothetical protein